MVHSPLPRAYLFIVAGGLILACGGSTGPSTQSFEALVGTWEQTALVYRVDLPSPRMVDLHATLPTCPSAGVCLIRPYFLMLRADTTYSFATVTAGDTTMTGVAGGFLLQGDSLRLEHLPYTSHIATTANQMVLRTDVKVDSTLATDLGFLWPAGADSLLIHATQQFDRR